MVSRILENYLKLSTFIKVIEMDTPLHDQSDHYYMRVEDMDLVQIPPSEGLAAKIAGTVIGLAQGIASGLIDSYRATTHLTREHPVERQEQEGAFTRQRTRVAAVIVVPSFIFAVGFSCNLFVYELPKGREPGAILGALWMGANLIDLAYGGYRAVKSLYRINGREEKK